MSGYVLNTPAKKTSAKTVSKAITVNYKDGSTVAKGNSKTARRPAQTPSRGIFRVRQPGRSPKTFLNLKIDKGNPDDIFKEMELYYDFGLKNISPRIHYLTVKGKTNPISLRKFVHDYSIDKYHAERYLVEQSTSL